MYAKREAPPWPVYMLQSTDCHIVCMPEHHAFGHSLHYDSETHYYHLAVFSSAETCTALCMEKMGWL
jgi:hypothetical protein